MASELKDAGKVTLAPVTPDDVPQLTKLHAAAFKSDLFFNLMMLHRDEGAAAPLIQRGIEADMSNPNATLIKAMDENGDIVGWACWELKGDTKEPGPDVAATPAPAPEAQPKSESVQTDTTAAKAEHVAGSEQQSSQSEAKKPEDSIRVLGGLQRRHRTTWEDTHLAGKKYLALEGLATHPRSQGRGVATKLVQWGINKADAESLSCYAHASPASHRLYDRAGFQELERDEYDLAEYAPGGKGGNRGWGVYTFRYMMRPAKNA